MLPSPLEFALARKINLSEHLQSVFSEGIFGELIYIVFLELYDLILALEVPLDLIDADVLCNVKHDELVGHYAQLLQGYRLEASAWEALDDPAAVGLLLELFNLELHQVNHNLVLNIRVGLARLHDLLAEFGLLLDLFPE
jgi:hypothetical protein